MMDADTRPYSLNRPFFSDLPAFVLTYQDKNGAACVATEKSKSGRTIVCFASLVDALIEVARFSQLGQQFHIHPAQLVQPSAFEDADGLGLIANVHLGWPVLDNKLMLRPRGALARCSREMHHHLQNPSTFEFDPIVLGEIARLHEQAGLFAWRETLDCVRDWEIDDLARVVVQALTSIEFIHGDPSQCHQVALFDPEAGQWHFVPIAVGNTTL